MDRETSPKPAMCRGGCGFYGSAATEGLCSQCYKKHSKRKQEFLNRNSANSKTVSPSSTSSLKPNTSPCTPSGCYSNFIDQKATGDFNMKHCNASGQSSSKRSSNSNMNVLENNSEDEEIVEEAIPSTSTAVSAPITEPVTEQGPETAPERGEPKEKKNRCAECGKKVGLTGFTCRCGGLYCAIHRYSDRHNCTFDYRELGAEEIRRNNPTVVAEKIRKI